MAFPGAYELKGFAAGILCLLSMPDFTSAFAAEHLEIQIRLHTTWSSPTETNKHETTAICVLGTNDWYIAGQFLRNARVEYWLNGTTILEHKVVTDSMYLERAKNLISEKLGGTKRPGQLVRIYPPKGQSSTRAIPWLEPFGYGVERAVWLAFCSGSFLGTPGREIPLPLGHFNHSQGCTDNTVLFEDPSGRSLPRSVVLFAGDGGLVCRYEVLASTNFLGHVFPTQFRLIQYGTDTSSVETSAQTTLLGEVTSMGPCDGPPVPKTTPAENE